MGIGFVTSITGSPWFKTGSGKSVTAGRIGEIVDAKNFNVDRMCFSPREFLTQLDVMEEINKPAQVLVMDEGEISAPSNLWYSFSNKAISYSLATFRYLKSMAIFVTPSLFWIDKRVRTLTSHWGYTTLNMEGDKKSCDLRLFQVHTDILGEKIFFKKIPFYNPKQKCVVFASSFKVGLPSQDFLDAYEKKSLAFKKGLRKNLVGEIDKFERLVQARENKEGNRNLPLKAYTDKLLLNEEIMSTLREKGKVDSALIRFALPDVSQNMSVTLARATNLLWTRKPMD
jgi:hypothetical protein